MLSYSSGLFVGCVGRQCYVCHTVTDETCGDGYMGAENYTGYENHVTECPSESESCVKTKSRAYILGVNYTEGKEHVIDF